VQISAPEGTGFAEMDRYMLDIQERLLPMTKEGAVRSIIIRTPGNFGAAEDFNGGNATIFLKPWEEREQTTQQVAQQVNQIIAQVPAVRGNAQVRNSMSRGRGQPISFVIAGSTYEGLA